MMRTFLSYYTRRAISIGLMAALDTEWLHQQAAGFPVGRKHIAMQMFHEPSVAWFFNRRVPFLFSEFSAIHFKTTAAYWVPSVCKATYLVGRRREIKRRLNMFSQEDSKDKQLCMHTLQYSVMDNISEWAHLVQVEKLCLAFEMTKQDSKDWERRRNLQEKGTMPIKVPGK